MELVLRNDPMPWRVLAISLAFASFLVMAYFGWASYRISGPVLFEEAREGNPNWPRKWPYPDEWLGHWGDQLAAEHPIPPGSIPIHGMLPLMQLKLRGWIVVSGLVGICLVLLGFRCVPYVSFTVPTAEPVDSLVERLFDRTDPKTRLLMISDESYLHSSIWDSGFKMMKLGRFPRDCPIVVCGRFKPWHGGAGTEIEVTARLFGPILWFLFLWFTVLTMTIACMIVMVETDTNGWFQRMSDLLDAFYALIGIALLSWVALVAWFRFAGRKSLEEITGLLSIGLA
jgi:hypothetical protein